MKFCPSCGANGIKLWQFSFSNSVKPARCISCQQQFYMSGKIRYPLSIFFEIGLVASIITCFVIFHWWPLLLLFIAWPIGYLVLGKIATPVPISEEEVKRRKEYGLWFLFFILVCILIAAIYESL